MATNAQRTVAAPNPRGAPPVAVSVTVNHETAFAPDGSSYHGLRVDGVVGTIPDVYFEVWAKPAAGGDDSWRHLATSRTLPMYARDPALEWGTSFTVALVLTSGLGVSVGPAGSTQASVTITTGPPPEDVTGFTATVEGGQVLFGWTALNETDNPDVLGYEVRAGATGWSSATLVGIVTPVTRHWFSVPRSKATGTNFYLKARTRLGAYSEVVATAVLSAASATCIDNDSLVGYQEVTITAGLSTVTVTTKCAYGSAPYITATSSVNARALSFTTYSYSVNGDGTYSFTLRASAKAPAAGSWTVHVHEAGA